ncbi:MAG: membrane protein insertase YidC, partial [Proteobacteria bacterium]|nr:membrane protein insertase YidC [Pseudomonadota bacterium]
MDIYRTFLAIVVSFLILIGYQYFFVGFGPTEVTQESAGVQTETVTSAADSEKKNEVSAVAAQPSQALANNMARPDREARLVTVDTDVYTALLTEEGGAVKSFILKDYKETGAEDSPGMQLIKVNGDQGLPLEFSWGSVAPVATFYEAAAAEVGFTGNTGKLVMTGSGNGLSIERTYTFNKDSYVMELAVRVKNISSGVLQGSAELHQSNTPFRDSGQPGSQFLFV